MGKKDVKELLSEDIDYPFIIELIIAISMIAPSIIMAFTGINPTLLTMLCAGALILIYALMYYLKRKTQQAEAATGEDFRDELKTRMNETLIMQLIFGVAMVLAAVASMILSGIFFDMNVIMTIVSGGLLIAYSIYYYRVRTNLMAEKDENEFDKKVRAKLNETFILQLIFGVAMVAAGGVAMIATGFDFNMLLTMISGGLLIAYAIYYYRVLSRLKQ